MVVEELSNQFDTLVSSYMRFRDFDDKEPKDTIEFNEYEKSLWLTKAQEEYVLSLYNGKNPFNESFEETEELRRYLSNLVCDRELTPILTSNDKPLGVDSKSKFFTLPQDPKVWFIIYESVITDDGERCDNSASMEVVPVRHDEYNRIRKNPFRGANNRRALRLDLSEDNVEIVCKYNVAKYYLRYLRKPAPILLVDLPDGLTVEEESTATEKLDVHESLHQRILELAVRMALQSKGYAINNNRE